MTREEPFLSSILWKTDNKEMKRQVRQQRYHETRDY